MKFLGKIWGGIKWAVGKVWAGMKWVGGKIWGGLKGAANWVGKQPAWKVALVGALGVATVVIASKLAKGGGDMDLYGQGGGGSGIATAAKVVGGAVAIGAGLELGRRAVTGVINKKKGSSSSSGGATQPTPVTDVTISGSSTTTSGPATTGGNPAKPPTSPMTITLGDQDQEQPASQGLEPVDDLNLNISDAELSELEGELDSFQQQEEEGPQGLGFSKTLNKVGS